VLDQRGKVVATFPYEANVDEITDAVKSLLSP